MTSIFSSTVDRTFPLSDVAIFPQPQESGCEKPRTGVVSEVPQGLSDEERWFEDELDSVIRELGQHAERAMAEGDKETAREYTRRMYAAIASRTPEHQARIEADIARRIDESTFQGEWTQEVLARAGAYFDVPAKAARRRTLG
jgi:hypothetical protein